MQSWIINSNDEFAIPKGRKKPVVGHEHWP